MFWKKRGLAAVLCMMLCMMAFPVPQAMAAGPETSGDTEIMPMMEYIYDASHNFVVSNGEAVMKALVRGNSDKVTKCEITVELQEKGLLFWDIVETWTITESGRSAVFNESHEVTSGKTYRMVATVTVWSGTDSETQTMTSKTMKA